MIALLPALLAEFSMVAYFTTQALATAEKALHARATSSVRHLADALPYALISGDSLHHPVQLAHPDLGTVGDVDPGEARTTRHRLLTELAAADDLLLGTHFAHPTSGRVRQRGNRFELLTDSPALLSPGAF